ncbi:MAG TPA: hypothetical protein DCG49_10765 [Ruminococcus sp.]|nr:hypothetical protein [Ruminococcus sp.]
MYHSDSKYAAVSSEKPLLSYPNSPRKFTLHCLPCLMTKNPAQLIVRMELVYHYYSIYKKVMSIAASIFA